MEVNLFYVIENYKGNETIVFTGTERECCTFELEARANLIKKNGREITCVHDFYTESKLKRERVAKKTKEIEEFKKTLTPEQLDEFVEIDGKIYARWLIEYNKKIQSDKLKK